jgi:riboflavin-specific deaminase-like protein
LVPVALGPPDTRFPEEDWASLWRTAGAAIPTDRPHLTVTMVSSVDGHVTEGGKVASLTGPPDQASLHRLRAASDGVLVGAGTVRAEGYDTLLTASEQAHRQQSGAAAQPLLCIVSASAILDATLPVFKDRTLRVIVLTASTSTVRHLPNHVEVLSGSVGASGELELSPMLAQLRDRYGVSRLLCEGGPTLVGSLLRAGMIDEMIMVMSPRVSGGGGPRPVASVDPIRQPLSLIGHVAVGGFVFLRYGVLA